MLSTTFYEELVDGQDTIRVSVSPPEGRAPDPVRPRLAVPHSGQLHLPTTDASAVWWYAPDEAALSVMVLDEASNAGQVGVRHLRLSFPDVPIGAGVALSPARDGETDVMVVAAVTAAGDVFAARVGAQRVDDQVALQCNAPFCTRLSEGAGPVAVTHFAMSAASVSAGDEASFVAVVNGAAWVASITPTGHLRAVFRTGEAEAKAASRWTTRLSTFVAGGGEEVASGTRNHVVAAGMVPRTSRLVVLHATGEVHFYDTEDLAAGPVAGAALQGHLRPERLIAVSRQRLVAVVRDELRRESVVLVCDGDMHVVDRASARTAGATVHTACCTDDSETQFALLWAPGKDRQARTSLLGLCNSEAASRGFYLDCFFGETVMAVVRGAGIGAAFPLKGSVIMTHTTNHHTAASTVRMGAAAPLISAWAAGLSVETPTAMGPANIAPGSLAVTQAFPTPQPSTASLAASEAGLALVCGVPEGSRLLRQALVAVAVAPMRGLGSAAVKEIAALAAACHVPRATVSNAMMLDALRELLQTEAGEDAVLPGCVTRLFVANVAAQDTASRLLALLLAYVGWANAPSGGPALCPTVLAQVRTGLRALSGALAALTAVGPACDDLVDEDSPLSLARSLCNACVGAVDVTRPEASAVAVARQLFDIAQVEPAVRATEVWVRAWVDEVPVLRHFLAACMVRRGLCGGVASMQLHGHVLAVGATLSARHAAGEDISSLLALFVGDDFAGAPAEGWVSPLVAQGSAELPGTVYRAAMLWQAKDAVGPSVLEVLRADVQRFHQFASESLHGAALEAPLRSLLQSTAARLFSIALQRRNFAGCMSSLHELADAADDSAEASEQVAEAVREMVREMCIAGCAQELVQTFVTHHGVVARIASELFNAAQNPPGVQGVADVEAARVTLATVLFSFLASRGAHGSAARAAYTVAAQLRSTPTRTPHSLPFALSLLCAGINGLELLPEHAPPPKEDDEDAGAAFSAPHSNSGMRSAVYREASSYMPAEGDVDVIEPFARRDVVLLRKREVMLRAELALADVAAPNCAPWDNEEVDRLAADHLLRTLVEARLWDNAAELAEAWGLDVTLPVVARLSDLLDQDAPRRTWAGFIADVTERSSPSNGHRHMRAAVVAALRHDKFKQVPMALKRAVRARDPSGLLRAYLDQEQRISASLAEEALELGVDYVESTRGRDRVSFGFPAGPAGTIPVTLLDRLAVLAGKVVRRFDEGDPSTDPSRGVLLAETFLTGYTRLLPAVNGADADAQVLLQ